MKLEIEAVGRNRYLRVGTAGPGTIWLLPRRVGTAKGPKLGTTSWNAAWVEVWENSKKQRLIRRCE